MGFRGHVLVDTTVGTIVDIGPKGFEVLALFSRPLTLGDAVRGSRLDTVVRPTPHRR